MAIFFALLSALLGVALCHILRLLDARPVCIFPFDLLSGALTGALYGYYGLSWALVLYGVFSVCLCLVSAHDIQSRIVPNAYVLCIAALGVAGMCLSPMPFLTRLWGLCVAAVPFALAFVCSRGAKMGLGDVKLMAASGFLLGGPLSVIALLFALVAAAMACLILLALQRIQRSDAIAFAPFLSFGLVASLFFGARLIVRFFPILLF